MRIIGLDVGTKTVGVALSDPLGITAQPFETITRKDNNKLRRTYARIEQIISEYDVTEIVVGYPKNMDDTIGERAKACEEFAAALERRTGLPVTLWDERLTTVEADEVLEECGMRRENRKTVIDQLAAVFILRGYMESKQKSYLEDLFFMDKLEFIDENGEKTQFYVIEETRINGINYLLVSESDNEDEEAEAYILKDTSDAASEEAVYEFVEEDSELEVVGKVFSELMDDDVELK